MLHAAPRNRTQSLMCYSSITTTEAQCEKRPKRQEIVVIMGICTTAFTLVHTFVANKLRCQNSVESAMYTKQLHKLSCRL